MRYERILIEVGVFQGGWLIRPKIPDSKRHLPPTISAQTDRPVNVLQLCRWQFSHKETLQETFFERSQFFIWKTKKLSSLRPPYRGLGATYAIHLRLIGKRVVDFLFVIIELFFTSCYACGATSEYKLESAVLEGGGSRRSKISDTRGHPPPTICARIDRPMNALQLFRWKLSHKETL